MLSTMAGFCWPGEPSSWQETQFSQALVEGISSAADISFETVVNSFWPGRSAGIVASVVVVVAVTVTVVVVAVADVVDVVVIDEVEDFEEHPIKDAIKTRLIIIERKTAYLFLVK